MILSVSHLKVFEFLTTTC